jgi:hypothetical protein
MYILNLDLISHFKIKIYKMIFLNQSKYETIYIDGNSHLIRSNLVYLKNIYKKIT